VPDAWVAAGVMRNCHHRIALLHCQPLLPVYLRLLLLLMMMMQRAVCILVSEQ
jgi:hypothetical protein